jgi:glycosyltransferase involved in cell wall biosynthesis
MKPLSLMHICNGSALGGTAATSFRLARLLTDRGHRVLYCIPPTGIWGAKAAEAGLEYSTEMTLRRGLRLRSIFSDMAFIRRIVKERQVDIVHVHRPSEYWRAALVLGSTPRKTKLIRSRGVVMPLKAHFANRWLHNKRTDLVICTAQAIYDGYTNLDGFDMDKVKLLHDGVDTSTFKPNQDGSEIRAQLDISPEAPVVGVIARIDHVKGHVHLINAAPAIVARFPDVRFILTGRFSREKLLKELKEQVSRLGVEKNFIFAGSLPDVPKVLAGVDVFALCSIGSEGSSRGTLEAMSCGLPVVASNVGCLGDIVVEEKTGFLVPHSTPEQLADRICRLLTNPELRKSMGQAGRQRIEENFDELEMVSRLEEHYYSLLKREKT